MNIYKTIYNQKHLTNEHKEIISTIICEWDDYRQCQRQARALNKGNITIRKLFAKITGITLPISCNWKTQEDLLKQFKIK